ncbi:homeobox-leucine zipper protein [Dioscorea alata]|uniref:Homeobox-leucine zipper protein n=1 Tax=Dioscorea alata TaxID=55571 RepID=A0ACB7UGF0_DIOAL|nr:homeobox-leucine zipper protein [Dioscorea alata]
MIANEDLGLSLSLSFFPPPLTQSQHHHQWPHDFAAAGSRGLSHSPTSHLLPRSEGIDVNQAPAGEREGDSEGEGGESSPNNSAVSSVSGKRDAGGGGQGSDDEDGDGSRKKLRLSKDQSAILEESFKEHNTLNPKQKAALAKQLKLRPRQVEVWFQNRRARTKLKQTEVDCELLKRCCETLTEENRRLHKELAELRALKLSPHLYMHMAPPTTLTMCPSCERIQSPTGATVPVRTPPWAPIPLRPSLHLAPAAPPPLS